MYQKKERYKVMTDFEKLVKSIIRECEEDGEPVTREEAEEMAKMEVKAKGCKTYATKEEKKPRKQKTRKIDNEKLEILTLIAETLKSRGYEVSIEKEVALHFEDFTLRLVKHRPPKK